MKRIQKSRYQKAQAEVLLFDNSDIITTSGMSGENSSCPGEFWSYQPGICQGGWGGSGNTPQWY